ncbi:cytochrome P450 315a1, mitochondrial isoform X1 [Neodiprion lecontei]|uniref:Cytochrome P450 315a1, mitochondrial isoform X1 n=1 Tax=Neodiprion lecontei TaxID=441921 RepID=A0A6J0C7D0_NEOLC|nr:cytochrome P450 315a1, mitochondrial isoform X1 [Neodiprion lecontei]
MQKICVFHYHSLIVQEKMLLKVNGTIRNYGINSSAKILNLRSKKISDVKLISKYCATKRNYRSCSGNVYGWSRKMWNEREEIGRKSFGTSTILPEMPEPRGLPLVGTTFSLIRAGGATKLHEYVDQRHKELGPVYRERMMAVEAIFVSSPTEFRRIFRLEGSKPKNFLPHAWILYNEMRKCERGLLFMEGDEWLSFRRIMNKLLLKSDSDDFMITPCKQAAETLVEDFRTYAVKGLPVSELERKLYQWSIEVMLAILVGSTWPRHKSEILLRTEKLAINLHNIFKYSAQLSLLPAKLAMNLKLPSWTKFVASADFALNILRVTVKEMIKFKGNGLIEMLMNEGILEDDLVRIVVDLILAAGDTTAHSMQWALFLLGSNRSVQEELFEKLKGAKGESAVEKGVLKGAMKESLRLYPTAPFLTRCLPEDSIVGGYHVGKGRLILMSLYTSGRDGRNFTNAETFSPERWSRNEKGDYKGVLNPHASLPFAMGARACVGQKLAEAQLTLTMAEMMKAFRIECINRDRVKMILNLVSVPSEPIQLLLTPRC